MDVLMLSRIQFAATAMFHFLFVPMTLGVVILIAIMQTFYYRTGDESWYKLVKFFGKLFIINFAVGVVTGISLEFQFGMNWANYSKYVGDIFGVPLAIEATLAFFLESVFLGLWIFGEKKISKKMHLVSIWLVAFGSNISALWILFANAFMQKPVGYVIRNGRVELNDFLAFIMSDYGWTKFFHTITSSYIVGAFLVMGISAYHILKYKNSLFKKSFKLASYFSLISIIAVIIFGDSHGQHIYKYQPTKFAAMESVWETKKGVDYPLITIPDVKNERNKLELIKIPKFMSLMAAHDLNAEIKGLKDFPEYERPPVLLTFLSFKLMVAFGMLFLLYAFISSYFAYRDKIEQYPLFLKIAMFMIPLPYIAVQLGWIVAEVGRQPWAVYGLLKVRDAVSPNLTVSQVWFSLLGYFIVYSIIGIVAFRLMYKFSVKELK